MIRAWAKKSEKVNFDKKDKSLVTKKGIASFMKKEGEEIRIDKKKPQVSLIK